MATPIQLKTKTLAILFADTKGYSKLNETQLRTYLTHVMPDLSLVLKANGALYANTWGDGLVCFFEDPVSAARCALAIRDYFSHKDWMNVNLPSDLTSRIALHLAPVHTGTNLVTEREDFIGSQVILTARIEPIVVPGHVFCTGQFVNQLGTTAETRIITGYLGELELAKGWGKAPVHWLHWSTDPDVKPKIIDEQAALQELAKEADPILRGISLLDIEGLSDQIIGNTILALGKSKDSRALSPLGRVLRDSNRFTPRQRVAAAAALKELGDHRSFEYLKDGIIDELDIVSITAIDSVKGLNDRRAVPILTEICGQRDDRSSYVRLAALLALIELEDQRSLNTFLECIDTEPDEIAIVAVQGLGKLRGERAAEKLRQLAASADIPIEVKKAAILALGEIRDRKAINLLISLLSDDWDHIKAAAIIALAKIGDYRAVPRLVELYRDTQGQAHYIRWGVIEKLHEFQDGRVVDVLLEALNQDDEVIRIKAIDSLSKLKNAKALSALTHLANDEDVSVRVRCGAIDAIGEMRKAEAVPILVKLLDCPAEDVVLRAINALNEIVSYAALGALVTVAVKRDRYPGAIRAAAASALRKVADNSVLKEVVELAQDPFERVAIAAIPVLGRLGGPECGGVLLKIVTSRRDHSPDTIVNAFTALNEMRYSPAVDQAIDALNDEDEIGVVRFAAASYLGRVKTSKSLAALRGAGMDESAVGAAAREALVTSEEDFTKLFGSV